MLPDVVTTGPISNRYTSQAATAILAKKVKVKKGIEKLTRKEKASLGRRDSGHINSDIFTVHFAHIRCSFPARGLFVLFTINL